MSDEMRDQVNDVFTTAGVEKLLNTYSKKLDEKVAQHGDVKRAAIEVIRESTDLATRAHLSWMFRQDLSNVTGKGKDQIELLLKMAEGTYTPEQLALIDKNTVLEKLVTLPCYILMDAESCDSGLRAPLKTNTLVMKDGSEAFPLFTTAAGAEFFAEEEIKGTAPGGKAVALVEPSLLIDLVRGIVQAKCKLIAMDPSPGTAKIHTLNAAAFLEYVEAAWEDDEAEE